MRTRPIDLVMLPGMLTVVLISGCEGLMNPEPDAAGAATDGHIRVRTVTTGALLDVDGYLVTVDGGDGTAVGRNDTAILPLPLGAGEHAVELTGIAENCDLWGVNPQQLVVVAGDTATAEFEAHCVDPRALHVSVATVGSSLDADGYQFTVDGGEERRIDINAAVTMFRTWSSGEHEIELLDVASNCEVTGPNPQVVHALPSVPSSASFDVSCDYFPGEIAYTSDRADVSELYTMDSSGSGVARITTSGVWGEPAWSPDGTKIAFASGGDDDWGWWDFDIYIMNADGTGLTIITGESPGGSNARVVGGRVENSVCGRRRHLGR